MILVAGGTGFVGGAITRELARRGHRVAVMSRNPASAANRFPGVDVTFRKGDVTDPGSLAAALEGVETVVGCQQFPNSPIENPGKGSLSRTSMRWGQSTWWRQPKRPE